MLSGPALEVHDMSELGPRLNDAVGRLWAPSRPRLCRRFGCNCRVESTSVVTVDIDQAFEACSATAILPSFLYFAARFRRATRLSSVVVRKGKKAFVRASAPGYGTGDVSLSCDQLSLALYASCYLTLVALGDLIFELRGLPIGAIMSAVCVSLYLGFHELTWREDLERQASAGFSFGTWDVDSVVQSLRYVDDVVGISHVLCPECLLAWMECSYPLPLSLCSGAAKKPGVARIWLDVEFDITGFFVFIFPKNPNRQWLFDKSQPRVRDTMVPWPGALPTKFSVMVCTIYARLYRAESLGLDLHAQCTVIMECVLEMHLMGYPQRILRALVHALPACPASFLARRTTRTWLAQRLAQHRASSVRG
jgi:hypothetical protein